MGFDLRVRTGNPDFLDLPWRRPLADWDDPRLIEVPRGLHRHVVKFLRHDERVYALKELSDRLARREWDILRHLATSEVPCVEVAAVANGRHDTHGRRLDGVIVTRHLSWSLPYRLLFQRDEPASVRDRMLDSLVELLVTNHLAGFLWGDCSLSNALFRRDAGQLTAYVVDVETGELHDALSDGQRGHDLQLAAEKCVGELLDLQFGGVVDPTIDAFEFGDQLTSRYQALWSELTREETFAVDESWRVHDRLRRINELGFDVTEVRLRDAGGGQVRLALSTGVVDPERHRRLLRTMTGLDAEDNQARVLLNDIRNYAAHVEHEEERQLGQEVAAHRWLTEVYEPLMAAVPPSLRGRLQDAELFHHVLQHRQDLAAATGSPVSNEAALASYVATVLRFAEPTEVLITADEDADSTTEQP